MDKTKYTSICEMFEESATLMFSNDHHERFLAERAQLVYRIARLEHMLARWDWLDFKPKSSYPILLAQLNAMKAYLGILHLRAYMEYGDEID